MMHARLINIRLAAIGALALGGLTGCSLLNTPGTQSGDQAILAACPPDKQVAADVEIDGSGSSSGDDIAKERLTITADVVRRVAICGGHLLVRTFSSSSGATVTIYDGVLRGDAALAELRAVPSTDLPQTWREAFTEFVTAAGGDRHD